VFASRELKPIERLLTIAAAQPAGASARAAALLDGMLVAANATRRPLRWTQAPAAWAALSANSALKTQLAKLDPLVVWPGKSGIAGAAAVVPLTPDQQERFATGKTLFTAVCATCHQVDGRGLDGLAPPLLDSEWVLGMPERLVRIVLHGVRGQITVLGRVHMGDMPGFGMFDDQQVSGVLTYLRREWGHTAPAINPDHVTAIRAATAGRADAWSATELNQIK
jgi:mono/diheme cytochrome c family protein